MKSLLKIGMGCLVLCIIGCGGDGAQPRTQAYALGQRGNASAEKGEYDKAIEDYTEAIRLDPKAAAIAYLARGKAFEKKGEHDKAEADFKEAKRLDPSIGLDNE